MVVTGARALEVWARRVTQGYPNVRILNMTSSWKDGLAFCAILHKFRPDLVDFSSLSPDQIERNCQLVFDIAEKELGIPALLDPKDMASCRKPDRLSILTYLAEFFHTFKDQEENKSSDTKLTCTKTVTSEGSNLQNTTNRSPSIEDSSIKHLPCDTNIVVVEAKVEDEADSTPLVENRISTELSRKDSGDSGVSMTSPRVSCSSPPPMPESSPSPALSLEVTYSSPPSSPTISCFSPPPSPGLSCSFPVPSPGTVGSSSPPSSLVFTSNCSISSFNIDYSTPVSINRFTHSASVVTISLPPCSNALSSTTQCQLNPNQETVTARAANTTSVFITCGSSSSSLSSVSPVLSISSNTLLECESPTPETAISSSNDHTASVQHTSGLDTLLKNALYKTNSLKASRSEDFHFLPLSPESKLCGDTDTQTSPLAARINKFEFLTPQFSKSRRNDWVMKSMCSSPGDKTTETGDVSKQDKTDKTISLSANQDPDNKFENLNKSLRSCTNPGFKSIRDRFQRISLG